MKICFLGNSHLTFCSAVAAVERSWEAVFQEEINSAALIFVAQDTPTDKKGHRDTEAIGLWVAKALEHKVPVIVSSQVPPLFMRRIPRENIYHQPETLRMLDASYRARNPERIVVGCADPQAELPENYKRYLSSFGCPILKMTFEEAEFSKIAVNMALAMQVDYANRMKGACEKIGADWSVVKEAVHLDRRIGKQAYLTPGRWQDSIHLLRDEVTLKEIENAL